MASSLSNLVDKLSEVLHRIKCNFRHDGKDVKHVEIDRSIVTVFFEYKNFKDNLIDYKCLCCNKNYQHKFDEKSKERFFNKYKFAKQNYIKFNLLFLKGFHPWVKTYETSLPEKKIFTIT